MAKKTDITLRISSLVKENNDYAMIVAHYGDMQIRLPVPITWLADNGITISDQVDVTVTKHKLGDLD